MGLELISPRDGEHIVSDEVEIAAVVGTPSSPVCVSMDDDKEECFTGVGPLGSRSAGVFAAFARIDTKRRYHVVRVSMGSRVKTARFSTETVKECASRYDGGPLRRVFDVFPFYGGGPEMHLLEMRVQELDDVTFIPIEANVTHSGRPKNLTWQDDARDDERFKRYDIKGFVADLTSYSEPFSREEAQRDAALSALQAAGAHSGDLIIIADADELVSGPRLRQLRHCLAVLEADEERDEALLPVILKMEWYMYDLRWRATRKWGLFAREGAVLVSMAMLQKRTASKWRRQLRDHQLRERPGDVRVLDDSGWHLSSFGGDFAVAEKLQSYIGVTEYGDEFYQDPDRLNRLRTNGIAYYELAGITTEDDRLFRCSDDAKRRRLPRFVPSSFWGSAGCPEVSDTAELKRDAAEARHNAVANGHVILGGWGAPRRVFEPTLDCYTDGLDVDETRLWDDLQAQCTLHRLALTACRQALPTLISQCKAELKDRNSTTISAAVDFQDTAEIPIQVDGTTHFLAIHSNDDVHSVAATACVRHSISPSQCPTLEDALRRAQPLQVWLDDPLS